MEEENTKADHDKKSYNTTSDASDCACCYGMFRRSLFGVTEVEEIKDVWRAFEYFGDVDSKFVTARG